MKKTLQILLILSLLSSGIYGQDAPTILTSYTEDDKGVIILVNGEADFPGSSGTIQKSNVDYWGEKLVNIIYESTGKKDDIVFRNGDNGDYELDGTRYEIGKAEGEKDAKYIKGKLKENGTVKIISHSKGSAFAVGYIEGLKKAEPTIKIGYNIMLAPHQGQSWDFPVKSTGYWNLAIRHELDPLSSKLKKTANSNIENISTNMMAKAKLYDPIRRLVKTVMSRSNLEKEQEDILVKKIKSINRDGTLTKSQKKDRINSFIRNLNIKYGDYLSDKEIDEAVTKLLFNLMDNHTINGFHFELKAALEELEEEEIDITDVIKEVREASTKIYDIETSDYRDP